MKCVYLSPTKAAKYSVSVSFPPWERITSVMAASTAQICRTNSAYFNTVHKLMNWTGNYCNQITSLIKIQSIPDANLFVCSRVRLPVSLNFSESQIRAIRQSTQKCAWCSLSEGCCLLHGILQAILLSFQRTRLKFIMQFQSINCKITFFCDENK